MILLVVGRCTTWSDKNLLLQHWTKWILASLSLPKSTHQPSLLSKLLLLFYKLFFQSFLYMHWNRLAKNYFTNKIATNFVFFFFFLLYKQRNLENCKKFQLRQWFKFITRYFKYFYTKFIVINKSLICKKLNNYCFLTFF